MAKCEVCGSKDCYAKGKCSKCYMKEYRKKWYKEHKAKRSFYSKKNYEKNKASILQKGKEYYYLHRQEVIKRNQEYQKIKTRTWRKEIISLLGSRCVRCGFNDIRALEIDHIYGGGTKHRHIIGSGYRYYEEILKDIKDGLRKYQLLCSNCNRIKMIENNERNVRRK